MAPRMTTKKLDLMTEMPYYIPVKPAEREKHMAWDPIEEMNRPDETVRAWVSLHDLVELEGARVSVLNNLIYS